MRGGFWRSRKRIGLLGAVLVASVMVAVLLTRGSAVADVTTWTIDADFDEGTLQGVNHDAPNQDQLQLNETGSTFPFLWIANAGEDTVSKIDTNTGKELARYHTWFGPPASHSAWSGPAPSRTAVDSDGSVYVANRHFDNRQPQVMKILSTGGIDRNGNGIIETSSDANSDGIISPSEMLPMTDSNGNGTIDPSEIADERVVWAAKAGVVGRLGRSLCIGTDGNIWLGTYSDRNYYKLSSADGSVLSGPHAVGVTTYGCLIDGNGTLWSASLSSLLGEIDTSTGTSSGPHSHGGFGGNYGIAIGNNKVYLGGNSRTYIEYDPSTGIFSDPTATNVSTLGVAVDGNGDIFAGASGGGIYKFDPAGNQLWFAPAQAGTGHVRGVVVDGNNDVWAVHLNNNNISKYKGSDGTALGVFPVGLRPYTYSDAAGLAALSVTTPTGFWTVVHDSGSITTDWGTVSWTDSIPTAASVEVSVRVADTEAGLDVETFQQVSNGVPFTATGRFIEVRAKLTANPAGDSPILFDIEVQFAPPGGYVVPPPPPPPPTPTPVPQPTPTPVPPAP